MTLGNWGNQPSKILLTRNHYKNGSQIHWFTFADSLLLYNVVWKSNLYISCSLPPFFVILNLLPPHHFLTINVENRWKLISIPEEVRSIFLSGIISQVSKWLDYMLQFSLHFTYGGQKKKSLTISSLINKKKNHPFFNN